MRDATVHVEDRGYQFADGVYEVCEVRGGRLIDERRHMERLERSLDELRIRHADVARGARRRAARSGRAQPRRATASSICRSPAAWRGATMRFPAPDVRAERGGDGARARSRPRNEALAAEGIAVISVPDNRWGRVDIKTIGAAAERAGRAGRASSRARAKPGSSTRTAPSPKALSANAWIVTQAGTVVTRPADHAHPARHHPHGACSR